MVYDVAEQMMERGLPFVFATGYDASAIPPRFAHVILCEKPISMKRVAQAIGRVMHD
jgi:hypothetical protein